MIQRHVAEDVTGAVFQALVLEILQDACYDVFNEVVNGVVLNNVVKDSNNKAVNEVANDVDGDVISHCFGDAVGDVVNDVLMQRRAVPHELFNMQASLRIGARVLHYITAPNHITFYHSFS